MITLNLEAFRITDTTMRGGFSLYALGDNKGNIFSVGSKEDITREFCKLKGITIYAYRDGENNFTFWLYANEKEFTPCDCTDIDSGMPLELGYSLYFPHCLNDKELIIYGLKDKKLLWRLTA